MILLLKDLHLLVELGFLSHPLKSLLFVLVVFIEIVSDATLLFYSVLADVRVELVCLGFETGQHNSLGLLTILDIFLKSFKN